MPPSSLPSCTTKTSLTRRDYQFQVQCAKLDAKLETYQYEGAKTILATMLSNDHTEWLKRLQHCLTHNAPMTEPTPPPTKKHYYKRSFRTYYVDTFVPPVPVSFVTVHSNTKPKHYNYWTDAAIYVYGDSLPLSSSSNDPIENTRKPKYTRPSSYVKKPSWVPLRTSLEAESIPDENVTASRPFGSKHTYQYLSHHKQHDSYTKFLVEDDTLHLDYARRQSNYDSTGNFRKQQQHLWRSLDAYLRRELATRTISTWLPILQQVTTMTTFLQTMKRSNRIPQQNNVASDKPRVPTHDTGLGINRCHIGTGIDHHKPTHRLQKRHQRYLAFVQSVAEHLSSNAFTPLRAPTLRQHQSYPCFAYSTNSLASSAPSLRQHSSIVALANHFLTETAIAPVDFRQHHVLDPSRKADNAHPFELHRFPCTMYISPYFQESSLTNPDGPGNILLFDINTTIHHGSLENFQVTLTGGISNPTSFPYSHSRYFSHSIYSTYSDEHCSHMGKTLDTYCRIFKHTFFPHASLFGVHTVCTNPEESCESLGNFPNISTLGIFNPFHFPYSHLSHSTMHCTESVLMWKERMKRPK